MGTLSLILFTVAFVAVGALFGDLYVKLHVSYNTWMIISIASVIVFIAGLIYEKMQKREGKAS